MQLFLSLNCILLLTYNVLEEKEVNKNMNNELLYPCFNQWKGSIWFIADTHFNDEDIEKRRNISDEALLKKINAKVSKNDTLVILGDVGDVEYVKKLKAGYKVLVMGNHDKGASNYRRSVEWAPCDKCDPYIIEDNKLFDEVYEGVLMINEKIILSHEPVEFKYAFNIHGHDHNGTDFKKYVLKKYAADMLLEDTAKNYLETIKTNGLNRLNVCAEWVGYSPINLKSIMKSGVLKHIIDIHRTAIDKATDKAKARK